MSLPHTQTAPVYVAGGTVQAGGGIYVRRAADDQLYAACLRGGLAYVLNSRQVGKSSLMIRAAERLLEEGGRVAIIDFTTMGANLTADDWYRGIVKAVAEQLDLGLEGGAWWDFQAGLGATDRFTRFFREALERLPGSVSRSSSTRSTPRGLCPSTVLPRTISSRRCGGCTWNARRTATWHGWGLC